MPIAAILVACVPLAWLIPSHYLPWLAAQNEFLALAIVCFAGLFSASAARASSVWLVFAALVAASLLWQLSTGQLSYAGDGWMVGLYVAAFVLAIYLGAGLAVADRTERWHALDVVAVATVAVSIVSVAIALMQWLDVRPISIPVYPVRPGDSPHGNVGQPNNFNTTIFLGVCMLGWLGARGRIGGSAWVLGSGFLLMGMVTTGSRTAWLQLGLALVLACRVSRSHSVSRPWLAPVFMLAAYALMWAWWPQVNDALAIYRARSIENQVDVGLRAPLWSSMIASIWQSPVTGYGWLQVASAQLAVVGEQPALNRMFEHTHNIVLDFIVWAGVPAGVALVVLAAVGLWQAIVPARRPDSFWFAVAACGVLCHAMLEFPLEYAYVLVPFGLVVGVLHGLSPPARGSELSPFTQRGCWCVVGLLLAVVAIDYLRAEQSYRTLRTESAFTAGRGVSQAPELTLLTQLGAFLAFTRTHANEGMSSSGLDEFERVARRYPHPPVLLRVALAQGLNQRPDAAAQTLRQLCAVHLPARCVEARLAWSAAQQRWPTLVAIPPP